MTSANAENAYPLGPALDFLRHVSALNHAMERLSSRMERELGVTAQQRLIIRCAGKYPGITAGQLAVLLHLDPGTVSASLRRLEERSLLERRRDPRDKRRVALGLTPAGRELDRPAEGTAEHAVERLLSMSRDAEVATAKAILAKLSSLLEAVAEPDGALPPVRARRR